MGIFIENTGKGVPVSSQAKQNTDFIVTTGGSPLYVFVVNSKIANTPTPTTNVFYNNVAMTQIGTIFSGEENGGLSLPVFWLQNPSTGNNRVRVITSVDAFSLQSYFVSTTGGSITKGYRKVYSNAGSGLHGSMILEDTRESDLVFFLVWHANQPIGFDAGTIEIQSDQISGSSQGLAYKRAVGQNTSVGANNQTGSFAEMAFAAIAAQGQRFTIVS